jgi:hypothetical protein
MDAIARMEPEVKVIFTADLFNEGVDIPSVNTVLMMRPTNSPLIFLQQLGRGLRIAPPQYQKDDLLVLDFVGNHNSKYRGFERYLFMSTRKDIPLQEQVKKGMPFLPAGCSISLTEQAQTKVLENIQKHMAALRGNTLKSHLINVIRDARIHLPLRRLMDEISASAPTTLCELKNGYYTLAPTFEHHLAEAKEDIEVEFRWLKGDDADYSGMAKAYRAWQLARKEVVPLTERVKKQPLLDYMVKWPEVRVRLAWKPVPSPVPEQTVKDEPPVKPVITFDRFKRIVDEFKAQGVGGAEFCLVGWNVGGHDGRWPQIFPVEPLLGGEAKLKEAIAWAQTNGYYVVAHCNHRDAYIIADSWDAEYIVEKNPDGSLRRGKGTWGGGRAYTICPRRAYERFVTKDMPMVAAMGFRGLHYLDVFSCVPPPFCDDPRHPVNERDGIKWVGHILQLGRDTFGGIASEGGYDQNAGQLDYVLYTSFAQPLDPSKYPALVDRYVPLFEIVYNGIILSNPFTTTVNAPIKGRPSELKTVEFAARPSFYFHANFLSTGRNWMGDTDLECFTDEQLAASVAAIKRGVDAYHDLARLQYRYIDRHAEAAPGVFLTQYDDGTKVYVNYNKEAASIDGTTIPAENWRLVLTEKK